MMDIIADRSSATHIVCCRFCQPTNWLL